MKNRIYKRGDVWFFEDYFIYLDENRELIPDAFAKFVCDRRRYVPGEESLYNARFVSLKEYPECERVVLKFRGTNNRLFTFNFKGVYLLKLGNPCDALRCRELLVHELHILRNGLFRYEFTSVTGDKIIIDFRDLGVTVK